MGDSSIWGAFATLALCVGGFWGLAQIVKKYGLKMHSMANSVPLNVLSKVSLTPKANVFVIRAGEKTLVVGTSDTGVNTLADITNFEGEKFDLAKLETLSKKEMIMKN